MENFEEFETEGEEMSEEKMKRIRDKFSKFLADVADDMLTTSQIELIARNIEKKLRTAGISPSLSAFKAFSEGFDFGVISHLQLEEGVGQVFAGIRRVIRDKEGKKPKMEIDITKSKPLPPHEDGYNTKK